MQVLCGLQVVFFLFNCQTPVYALVDFRYIYYSIITGAGNFLNEKTVDKPALYRI